MFAPSFFAQNGSGAFRQLFDLGDNRSEQSHE
jgi:hypothetical protein